MNILMVLGGGIGNIIQATPAIQRIIRDGHVVDLMLHCNSSSEMDIFRLDGIREIYHGKNKPKIQYDYQINGPFTPGDRYRVKSVIKTKPYIRHYPESQLYLDILNKINIKQYKVPFQSKIQYTKKDYNLKPKTVAIYPGSKETWGMKRWDKYDDLSREFDNAILVGTKRDINSNGVPAWFSKRWNWQKGTTHFEGTLNDNASLLSQCSLFVGNDGGMSHIAAATGIPTFIIFGPTSHIKNKPKNDNAYVISYNGIKEKKLPCQPCQFGGEGYFKEHCIGCHIKMKCMDELTVEDVMGFIKKKVAL